MQRNLIVEEFKEFLEAEGMLFRQSLVLHEEAIKELTETQLTEYAEELNN